MRKRFVTVLSAALVTLALSAPAYAAHQGTPGEGAGCAALESSPAVVNCDSSPGA
jgi:hypothetical protein